MEAEAGGSGGDPSGGLGSIFNDPNMITKLASNPKTAPLLADQEFMAKLQSLKANPNNIGMEMQDPRFLQVMSVLLGIDMQFGAPGEQPAAPKEAEEDAKAAKEAKAKADEEKKKGTEFYKKRQFDQAIEHYSKAWEMHKDITYLTNLGAAKFEKGDYQGCIEACQQAVEHGREILADFKVIAK
ncbi:hypothetical protein GQ43DRAFT_186921 [Delitschia confertaspora ATCC 74209]|uniref:STI1/HOP DP domain-containing protein n=1 Tax=Delitschia confertaspora ATCC 74209 TaxID=1513339 RepID=A0A9P4MP42_9PLEO|nr:hypothetical protein GQ43DRAFT_186921 [Delitschia confertaspora ATCC 74209]